MTEPVRFKVTDLVNEVRIMQRLGARFLREDALPVMKGVENQIEVLRGLSQTQTSTIEVNLSWPIRTRPSNGGYERCNGGAHKDLFGEFLFKWQLRPLERPNTPHRQVAVVGIASSVCRLRLEQSGDDILIASWRMELGDNSSPGAFFHAQIPDTLGANHNTSQIGMWPPWLPVPRLPIPVMTPMLALEFLLAEIFQDGWRKHLRSGGSEVEQWCGLQKDRYVAYFDWQRKVSEESAYGSPILSAKNATPKSNMFVQ